MIDAFTFNVSADLLCLCLTMILLFSTRSEQSDDGRRKIYSVILLIFTVTVTGNLVSLLAERYTANNFGLLLNAARMVSDMAGALMIPGIVIYIYSNPSGYRKPKGITLILLYASQYLSMFNLAAIAVHTFLKSCILTDSMFYKAVEFIINHGIFTIMQGVLLMTLIFLDKELKHRKAEITIYCLLPLTAVFIGFFNQVYLFNLPLSCNALLLIYINYQLRMEEELIQRDLELSDLQMSLLIGQIKPHFIFNVLNSIYYLCESDPVMASEAVSDFSEYLRTHLLETDSAEPIPFEKELHHVQLFERLQRMRFDQISISYDIREKAFRIPALTVQPLVENAIRHGYKESEKGTVVITSRKEGKDFIVTVSDSGTGFDVSKLPDDTGKHVGLENVRRRLDMIEGASLHINSDAYGTEAQIRIPASQRINQYE